MTNFKLKYFKYKLKYLSLKKNKYILTGGSQFNKFSDHLMYIINLTQNIFNLENYKLFEESEMKRYFNSNYEFTATINIINELIDFSVRNNYKSLINLLNELKKQITYHLKCVIDKFSLNSVLNIYPGIRDFKDIPINQLEKLINLFSKDDEYFDFRCRFNSILSSNIIPPNNNDSPDDNSSDDDNSVSNNENSVSNNENSVSNNINYPDDLSNKPYDVLLVNNNSNLLYNQNSNLLNNLNSSFINTSIVLPKKSLNPIIINKEEEESSSDSNLYLQKKKTNNKKKGKTNNKKKEKTNNKKKEKTNNKKKEKTK